MTRRAAFPVIAGAVAAALLFPATAAATDREGAGRDGREGSNGRGTITRPTLVARATLSADFLAPGPPSGAQASAANGRQGPFPGQVIPGFSGVVEAEDGTFWALPDNGLGAKTNSADLLLRPYHVTPQWQTADGGTGEIEVGEFISLRDPDRTVDFPIVNGDTPDRLLTGAESSARSCSTWTRRGGCSPHPCRCPPESRRRARTSSPARPRGCRPVAGSRRWRLRETGASSTRCWRAPSSTMPTSVDGPCSSSTPPPGSTPSRPGPTRPTRAGTSSATRSRPVGERCSSSSATTSRVPRR